MDCRGKKKFYYFNAVLRTFFDFISPAIEAECSYRSLKLSPTIEAHFGYFAQYDRATGIAWSNPQSQDGKKL